MAFFDPARLVSVYRNPVALSGLVVDLLPIYAVFAFGWGAAALVFLYWLENLIIGAATLLRMLGTGALSRTESAFGAVFAGAFFTVHYGLFCFVHGVFLAAMVEMGADGTTSAFPGPAELVGQALTIAPGIGVIAAVLLAWHLVTAFEETRQAPDTSLKEIMMSPYGRIVVLHVGLFAGFAAMTALGDPLPGVLALILLDVAWGVFLAVRRHARQTGEDAVGVHRES